MSQDIVFPEELDYFVQSLRQFHVSEIGNSRWLETHEMIIKLGQQAVLEASTHREESVKEAMITHRKLGVLIHEAYCVLIWKTKVLPNLLSIEANPQATFLIYTVLFHEGAAISLLEACLFHQNAVESLGDFTIDIIDYCAQAISQVIGLTGMGYHESFSKVDLDESVISELERQKRDMLYKIGLRCVSVLNYIVDKVDILSISAVRRVVITHDIPWLLSDMLHFRPWQRKVKEYFERFIDEKWQRVEGDTFSKISKYEAQCWFILRNLLFNPKVMGVYELNDGRIRQLGKCQGLLNEVVLDQLPPLIDLKHFLGALPVESSRFDKKTNLVFEELPQIKENLEIKAEKEGGYMKIANQQSEIFLTTDSQQISSLAQKLSSAYNTDVLAEFDEPSSKDPQTEDNKSCKVCQKAAEKKCGNCSKAFYCSKDCQVKHWPIHKKVCLQE